MCRSGKVTRESQITMSIRSLTLIGLCGGAVLLLTLDQLGRAAALICAMELERHDRSVAGDKRPGDWPFEIGLWVGSTATPNRMVGPNDNGPGKETTA